ncbi:MAG: hypothetical protein KA059_06430 [Elusimicrobiales bacterium]|jgi:Zn ribbon nucleic-acid-binding protein|nr:hypothetical protein [Elusimicrobiales bacterium]NLH39790.1 hypothetical protein [Elusimicrobiota bacterium]
MSECPLCKQNVEMDQVNGKDVYEVECRKCGKFYISAQTIKYLVKEEMKKEIYKISSYTRECAVLNKKTPFITLEKVNEEIVNGEIKDSFYISVDEILNEKFPYLISERLDKTLLNYSKMAIPGKWINSLVEDMYPLAYCEDEESWEYIVSSLIKSELIEGDIVGIEDIISQDLRLTPMGWNKVAELERGSNINSNQVFVAMWFDKSMDEFWEKGFKSVISDLGFTPIRVDKKEHNEKICDVIISEIRKSKFLIADFTGDRGGVYYEAGFAKGLGIPVIFTCQKEYEKDLHFDTRQYNHIIWENIEDLKTKLGNRIQATIP